jgi:hypothetical protein
VPILVILAFRNFLRGSTENDVTEGKSNYCGCGCGGLTNGSNRFVHGHTNKGTHLPEEHKRRISLANKDRHFSEEHKRNLSLAHKGNYHSEESKQKLRLANLGERNSSWKDGVGYSGLHKWINRNKPKPQSGLCEICNNRPLHDDANITGIYNRDFKNWKYTCHSCNIKSDFENGTRRIENISGERNSMVGRKHTDETKFIARLARESRKYAKMMFMSGRFHILKQDWMKRISTNNSDDYISSEKKGTRGGHI